MAADRPAAFVIDDTADCCAFCGSDLDDRPSIATMMHEAHEAMERLAAAEPGTDEFDECLDYVRRFVGA